MTTGDRSYRTRSWDALLPFLIGLLMGVMTGYATINGRVATLEANELTSRQTDASLDHRVSTLENTMGDIRATLSRIDEKCCSK